MQEIQLGNVKYLTPFASRGADVVDGANYTVATCFNPQVAADVAKALNLLASQK